MSRPRKKKIGQWYIWDRKGNPYWYAYRQLSENPKNREYVSTGKRKSEYTRVQIERIMNEVQGIKIQKMSPEYTIDWAEEYITRQLKIDDLENSTIELYKIAFKHLRKIYGGHYSILNLTRKDILQIKEHFIILDRKPTTINKNLRTLSAAFNRLELDEIISKNPFKSFKRMKDREARDKKKHLTLIELNEFLKFAKENANEELFRLIRIYATTGRRRNEILYLKHDHVDIDKGIYRPLDIKSRDKHRIVKDIPDESFEDFKYFIKKYKDKEHPFLIYHDHTITHKIGKLFVKAGYPSGQRFNIHTFRHTYQTQLDMQGFSRRKIAQIIGYSDESIVDIYTHVNSTESPEIGIKEIKI